MDLARAPCRAPLTARKMGSGYENDAHADLEQWMFHSLVPVVLKQAREKMLMWYETGTSRCDVTAKGASERLADFSIFNMAENLYIQITL
jgi:hypothetical protein